MNPNQLTLTCFQELEVSVSPSKRKGSKQSGSRKLTTMPQKSSKDIGRTCQITATSETFRQSGPASLQEDFLANHSLSVTSRNAMTILENSGLKCLELLSVSGRTSCFARMLMTSPVWGSICSLLIWKAKVTPSKRLFFQLSPLARFTGETEFGLLGTPTKNDSKNVGINLSGQSGMLHLRFNGRLNPRFVEQLMGFPPGWTELDAVETPSCHESLKSSRKQSGS